ncbi:hypothetical protein MOK15_19500 [Sphingobium sp. BYY-5]|uniref:hypothetical protein n=1 Tax=Sphingobium sp. BYY-5 TaxID=2926400 RepID=UPI001FA761EE|nr:hypothetical protein [Sphingobium sp. BYY-5]MCI4592267.1 hypothetical protein [Sphingobium sp. BYY-5]
MSRLTALALPLIALGPMPIAAHADVVAKAASPNGHITLTISFAPGGGQAMRFVASGGKR